MPFQIPITIAAALKGIQKQNYVLPAIQREFVWNTDQICRLFDSMLRGYPIGSFLFWNVDGDHVSELRFYGFILHYNQLTNPHCPILDLPAGHDVTAILDGQQRLTALNIGLRGSHAARLPGRWAKIPASYPKQLLYLNLCRDAPENEQGMIYDFRFFVEPPGSNPVAGIHWYPVHQIFAEGVDTMSLHGYLVEHELAADRRPFATLERLRLSVHNDPIVNYYEEGNQDIDRVLDIFIRVNSGGTVLSYSDLLLSIATAQWDVLDARDAIHGLVDELNALGAGFALNKDSVLKAGLVLTEVSDVGFKVTNFNRTNMATLEREWGAVETALQLAVSLLADFGFSSATLTANSVVIPMAYYVHSRHLTEQYRTSGPHRHDRELLRSWVIRSLLKPGVWGSGLDTLLRELRRVIREHGENAFPAIQIEAAMLKSGKSLVFSPAEVDELAEISYGDKRAFSLLALLYPDINTRKLFHIDHVFPRKFFRKATLVTEGIPEADVVSYQEMVNRLPNLQLLEESENLEKQAKPPLAWATGQYGAGVTTYILNQDLGGLSDSLQDFASFFATRRERMVTKLQQLLAEPTTDIS